MMSNNIANILQDVEREFLDNLVVFNEVFIQLVERETVVPGEVWKVCCFDIY